MLKYHSESIVLYSKLLPYVCYDAGEGNKQVEKQFVLVLL